MAQQLMTSFNWTLTSVVFDTTITFPFLTVAARYIVNSIRLASSSSNTQIFTFPVNSLEKIDYDGVLREISGLCRGRFTNFTLYVRAKLDMKKLPTR